MATAEFVNKVISELLARCPAWKNAATKDASGYLVAYKSALLQSLITEGVSTWEQVQRGLASLDSPFLPNQNEFARSCKGSNEITGTGGTGAHKIYRPDRALENKENMTKDGAEKGRAAMRAALRGEL